MTQPPCKDCSNREVGCHSACKLYLEYKEIRIKEIKWCKEQNLRATDAIGRTPGSKNGYLHRGYIKIR